MAKRSRIVHDRKLERRMLDDRSGKNGSPLKGAYAE